MLRMPLKRTLKVMQLLMMLAALVALGLAGTVSVTGQDAGSPVPGEDAAEKIENAMSAGPSGIAEAATILDNELDDADRFVVLREGNNDWYCFPDVPGTPGNDPACYDQTWLDWNYAYVANEEPTVTTAGFAYMLQGGSDASNTDPFATEPDAGEDWVTSPPHVMILLPGEIDLTAYSTDHGSGGPYVMWAGTPYEHIMLPVADHEHEP